MSDAATSLLSYPTLDREHATRSVAIPEEVAATSSLRPERWWIHDRLVVVYTQQSPKPKFTLIDTQTGASKRHATQDYGVPAFGHNEVVFGGGPTQVVVDAQTLARIGSLKKHTYQTAACAVTPSGFVSVGGKRTRPHTKTLRYFDASSFEEVNKVKLPKDAKYRCNVVACDGVVVVDYPTAETEPGHVFEGYGFDGELKWRRPRDQVIRRVYGTPRSDRFFYLVETGERPRSVTQLVIADSRTGAIEHEIPCTGQWMSLSADGQWLLVSTGRRADLIHVPSGTKSGGFQGPTDARYSEDGAHIVGRTDLHVLSWFSPELAPVLAQSHREGTPPDLSPFVSAETSVEAPTPAAPKKKAPAGRYHVAELNLSGDFMECCWEQVIGPFFGDLGIPAALQGWGCAGRGSWTRAEMHLAVIAIRKAKLDGKEQMQVQLGADYYRDGQPVAWTQRGYAWVGAEWDGGRIKEVALPEDWRARLKPYRRPMAEHAPWRRASPGPA